EMARALLPLGYAITEDESKADAIIINTCTVRQHAEDKAVSHIGMLKHWKAANPNGLIIVAGCAAERAKAYITERFPHVDLVVGAKSIERFPDMIKEALAKRFDWNADDKEAWSAEAPNPTTPLADASSLGYVTIMRGCNYSCSYCIVPAVRGRELYRPTDTIIEETRERLANGAQEIVLLGQTVNSYKYQGVDFSDLLRCVAEVEGVKRLSFMSPHPYYFTDRLIDTLAALPSASERIHLPAQSGNDRILNLMRRNYTRAQLLDIVRRLKSAIPGAIITTDVIVGFPTESEDDFRDSLTLLKEAGVAGAYCFKFSPRQGTQAAGLEETVSKATKERRLSDLLNTVRKLAHASRSYAHQKI
ncbi:MAG: MiaB/RimO family radical SAM methylthiotransferase, partial [Elusimicrobiota bacterium]